MKRILPHHGDTSCGKQLPYLRMEGKCKDVEIVKRSLEERPHDCGAQTPEKVGFGAFGPLM